MRTITHCQLLFLWLLYFLWGEREEVFKSSQTRIQRAAVIEFCLSAYLPFRQPVPRSLALMIDLRCCQYKRLLKPILVPSVIPWERRKRCCMCCVSAWVIRGLTPRLKAALSPPLLPLPISIRRTDSFPPYNTIIGCAFSAMSSSWGESEGPEFFDAEEGEDDLNT